MKSSVPATPVEVNAPTRLLATRVPATAGGWSPNSWTTTPASAELVSPASTPLRGVPSKATGPAAGTPAGQAEGGLSSQNWASARPRLGASIEVPSATIAAADGEPRGHGSISGSRLGTLVYSGEQGSTSRADGWAKEGGKGSSCWPGRRRSSSVCSQADVACLGTDLRHVLCSLQTNTAVSDQRRISLASWRHRGCCPEPACRLNMTAGCKEIYRSTSWLE